MTGCEGDGAGRVDDGSRTGGGATMREWWLVAPYSQGLLGALMHSFENQVICSSMCNDLICEVS